MKTSQPELTIAIAILSLTTGCKPDEVESTECSTESYVSYENFGKPFMTTWCTPCHSSELALDQRQEAPLGVDFDSYEGILAHSDAIRLFVVDTDAMPPAGGPDDTDIDLLREWLDCNLPESR